MGPDAEKFLIIDPEHSHEYLLWWRPNGRGYTYSVDEAGRYSREEVAKRCDGKRSVPIPEHVAVGLATRVVSVDWMLRLRSVDHLAAKHTPQWLVKNLQ